MALTITVATRNIFIPQADLTPLGPDLFLLDTNQLRLWLKDWEDSEEGAYMPDTHRHNTEVSLGGITLARTIEIINGYTIEFEEFVQPYAVQLSGSNNNVADVAIVNNVSIRSNNSAGLTSPADPSDIADAVMDNVVENALSMRNAMRLMMAALYGKLDIDGDVVSIRDTADSKDRIVATTTPEGKRTAVTLDPD